MKINCIIGIDPGSNGGIVVWRPNHNATAIKMPKDINEIRDFLNYYKEICTPIVFLERGFPLRGAYPISRAVSLTRSAEACPISGLQLSAFETVETVNPVFSAISFNLTIASPFQRFRWKPSDFQVFFSLIIQEKAGFGKVSQNFHYFPPAQIPNR